MNSRNCSACVQKTRPNSNTGTKTGSGDLGVGVVCVTQSAEGRFFTNKDLVNVHKCASQPSSCLPHLCLPSSHRVWIIYDVSDKKTSVTLRTWKSQCILALDVTLMMKTAGGRLCPWGKNSVKTPPSLSNSRFRPWGQRMTLTAPHGTLHGVVFPRHYPRLVCTPMLTHICFMWTTFRYLR